MTNSPLTDTDAVDPDESAEEIVSSVVWFRVSATDAEWNADVASSRWNLSREEAARRLDEKDYSPL